jgi:hypothetical protein
MTPVSLQPTQNTSEPCLEETRAMPCLRKIERITDPDTNATLGYVCELRVGAVRAYGFGETGAIAQQHANDSAAKQGWR